jgi:hypothetical protein
MKKNKIITHQEQSPIIIHIDNPTNKQKNWVLFGTNVFLHEKNFGSDNGLVIQNEGIYSYQSLLQDLSSRKISIGLLRIYTDDMDNFNHLISFKKTTNSMQSSVNELILEYLDPHQFQSDICQTPCEIILDKDFSISGHIEPCSKMILSFHPSVIIQEKNTNILLKVSRNIITKIKNLKIKIFNSLKRKSA